MTNPDWHVCQHCGRIARRSENHMDECPPLRKRRLAHAYVSLALGIAMFLWYALTLASVIR